MISVFLLDPGSQKMPVLLYLLFAATASWVHLFRIFFFSYFADRYTFSRTERDTYDTSKRPGHQAEE